MKEEQERVLPYEALESLGINKKDLKASDTEALLAGNKTDLMKFSVEDTKERRAVLDKEKVEYTSENGKLNFEGKVQLQKYMTVDNTEENKNILKGAKIDFEELQGNKLKLDSNAMRKVAIGLAVLVSPVTALALVLVPKRTEVKNDLGLTDKDIKDLKKGEAVGHTNAKGERLLVQLDKDTNNLVSVRSNDISIPNKIAGQEITPIQKELLKSGKEIQVKDSTGQTVFAKIDLNEKTGLSLKDENGQKITLAPEIKPEQKPEITPKDSTQIALNDRIILADIAKNGLEGINHQFHTNDKELKSVLERYNLNPTLNNLETQINLARGGSDPEIYKANQEIPKLENQLKDEAGQQLKELDREILTKIKNEGWQAVEQYKDTPIDDVLKRHGLQEQFNDVKSKIQDFHDSPAGETERAVNYASNNLMKEAEIILNVDTAKDIIKDIDNNPNIYLGEGSKVELERASNNMAKLDEILSKHGNSSEIERFGEAFRQTDTEMLIHSGIAEKLNNLPYIKENPLNIDRIETSLSATLGEIEAHNLSSKKEDIKLGIGDYQNDIKQNYGLTDKQVNEFEKRIEELHKELKEVERKENKLDNSLGEFYNSEKTAQGLTNDKDRLQHIANNGVDGIRDIHPTDTKLRDDFFEKYNLSREVQLSNDIKNLSPEEYNKQGKGLDKEMDSLSNSLKSKASGELSGFERENSVKSEVKQETTSFKMKM